MPVTFYLINYLEMSSLGVIELYLAIPYKVNTMAATKSVFTLFSAIYKPYIQYWNTMVLVCYRTHQDGSYRTIV